MNLRQTKVGHILYEARMAYEDGHYEKCVEKAKIALNIDPVCLQALRLIAQSSAIREKRLAMLRKAWRVARTLEGSAFSIDTVELEPEIVTVGLALADELAAGCAREKDEAIRLAETIGRYERYGLDFSAPRVARWCAETSQWGRGLPWACVLASFEDLEGFFWAALFMGSEGDRRHFAEDLLRRALEMNTEVGAMLMAKSRPELTDEASRVACNLWDGWQAGRDRIDTVLGDMLFEFGVAWAVP